MEMKCPECETANNSIDLFSPHGLYLNHYHYKCSNCGFKWGINIELIQPSLETIKTLKEQVKDVIIELKNEGVL